MCRVCLFVVAVQPIWLRWVRRVWRRCVLQYSGGQHTTSGGVTSPPSACAGASAASATSSSSWPSDSGSSSNISSSLRRLALSSTLSTTGCTSRLSTCLLSQLCSGLRRSRVLDTLPTTETRQDTGSDLCCTLTNNDILIRDHRCRLHRGSRKMSRYPWHNPGKVLFSTALFCQLWNEKFSTKYFFTILK